MNDFLMCWTSFPAPDTLLSWGRHTLELIDVLVGMGSGHLLGNILRENVFLMGAFVFPWVGVNQLLQAHLF